MKKNHIKVIAICIVIAVLIGSVGCYKDVNAITNQTAQAQSTEDDAAGRSGTFLQNAMNSHRTAEGDDVWVYFFSNEGEKGLYKMKHDGGDKQLLYACDSCESVNVLDEWIYFVSDKIYRIRTDGTDLSALTMDDGLSVQVVDDVVYYQSVDNGTEIMRMNLDGTDKQTVGIENIDYYVATDKEIFFAKHTSTSIGPDGLDKPAYSNLYKKIIDSGEEIQLSKRFAFHFAVSENLIYYTYDDFIMRKMNPDGGNSTNVFGDSENAPQFTESFWISDDIVFYKYGDELFRTDTTCANEKLLTDDFAYVHDDYFQFINIVGDWIYYFREKKDETYRISLDGTTKQKI